MIENLMSRRPNHLHDNIIYNNLSNNSNNPEANSYPNQTSEIDSNTSTNNKSTRNSKSNFCLVLITLSVLCAILFLVNLIATVNAFEENKVITMKAEEICKQFISEHNACLNKYRNKTEPQEIIDQCFNHSINLQYCYDQVYKYNKKCYVYFSEFEKCVRDNEKINDSKDYLRSKCKDIEEGIKRCTSEFFAIDPFILLKNL